MIGRCLALAALLALGAGRGGAETWVEVRSPHVTVRSDASEEKAEETARRFERFRVALAAVWPWIRADAEPPVVVYAVRSESGLRRLLPTVWEEGGRRPAGVALSGLGGGAVVLRLDVPLPRFGRRNPVHVLQHEYVHLLLELKVADLPPWLHEGLAEYLGAAVVDGDALEVGWPIPEHVLLLRQQRLLPTAALFGAVRAPDGRAHDRSPVFYAQSWALVHHLLHGDWKTDLGAVGAYLTLRAGGVGDVEATRRALGDADALDGPLRSHVGALSSTRRRLPVPVKDLDLAATARELTEAEIAAARGELMLLAGFPDRARALYEEALELDPGSPSARQGLGLLAYHAGRENEAFRWLDGVAESADASAATCYLHAALLWKRDHAGRDLERIRAGLRRALERNPGLVPARELLHRLGEDARP